MAIRKTNHIPFPYLFCRNVKSSRSASIDVDARVGDEFLHNRQVTTFGRGKEGSLDSALDLGPNSIEK